MSRWIDSNLADRLYMVQKRIKFPVPMIQIIFPQKLFTAPGGSRDSENFNLRHKSRDEIIREMIDEGYNMKLS